MTICGGFSLIGPRIHLKEIVFPENGVAYTPSGISLNFHNVVFLFLVDFGKVTVQ